jgi:undecaprenyl pyrophosphate phosphatase UppP
MSLPSSYRQTMVIGLGALSWLNNWLKRGRLRLFAGWCIPLGVVVTVWQLWVMFR